MPNTNTSPNMSLPVPIVGTDPGPQYATDVNSCLTILDAHDHSPGNGVPITPSGLNINTDLSFNSNNATVLRSVRFTAQNSPLATASDLGCIYEAGVDLYYNDGAGNQVRITQSGAIAGTPGSISNLSAPASASYSSGNQTFVWQSNVSTAANMDAGSYTFREVAANAKGITVSSPTSLAADFTFLLPPKLPSASAVFTVDNSGTGSFKSPYLSVFDGVVGSSAQVTGGIANYSSFASAISALSANNSIKVLQGAWTETVTVSKTLNIAGGGKNSVITGSLVVSSNYSVIEGLSFTGSITLDSSTNGCIIKNCYIPDGQTVTDNGAGNYIEIIQG